MFRYKYKYEDLHCDFCADKKSAVCSSGLCPHIMENIADLLDDDNFYEAIGNADNCRITHKKTLLYLKSCHIEKLRGWGWLPYDEAAAYHDFKPECRICKYAGVGFICYNEREGSCLRDWLREIKYSK